MFKIYLHTHMQKVLKFERTRMRERKIEIEQQKREYRMMIIELFLEFEENRQHLNLLFFVKNSCSLEII